MINFGLCAQNSLNPSTIALLVVLGVAVAFGIVFAVIKIYRWVLAKRSAVRILTKEEYLEELRKEREAAGLPFEEDEKLNLLDLDGYKNDEIDNNSIDLTSDGANIDGEELSGEWSENSEDDKSDSSDSDDDAKEKIVFPIDEEDENDEIEKVISASDEDLEEDNEQLEKIIHPDERAEEVGDCADDNATESLVQSQVSALNADEVETIDETCNEAVENIKVSKAVGADETTATEEDVEDSDLVSAYDDFIEKSVENGASVIEDDETSGSGKIVFAGKEIRVRYLRSFTAKLSQSNDLLKERYSILKNELLSYKKAKARTSWYFETFRQGRLAYAKFAVRGKTLTLYLALNPEDLVGTKYRFKDVGGVKKYAQTPVCVKIKSNRGVRWAKELIAILANEKGFKRLDLEEVDYYPDYRSTKDLILDKQIKLVGVDARKEFLKIQNDDFNASYSSNFSDVAVTCDSEIPQIDNNSIDLVEKTKNSDPYAVILEVDLNEEDALFRDDVSVKTVEETSGEKAEMLTEELALKDDEEQEEVESLVERDFEIKERVSVFGADKAMTNEEAEGLIETAKDFVDKKVFGTAKAIINVDVLSNNFTAGETVTLKTLIDKNLLPKKTGYFKVLGRGVINKPLTVEADEFSINAAKMILITGGRAIIVTR